MVEAVVLLFVLQVLVTYPSGRARIRYLFSEPRLYTQSHSGLDTLGGPREGSSWMLRIRDTWTVTLACSQ